MFLMVSPLCLQFCPIRFGNLLSNIPGSAPENCIYNIINKPGKLGLLLVAFSKAY